MSAFSEAELAYLATQRLGRLATIDRDGNPQNNPVSFQYNAEFDAIDIGGFGMGDSRKFRNVTRNERVSFVVDDVPSIDPWRVRCVEVRGTAEALTGQEPQRPGMSGEVIRVHPRRVISFGITEPAPSH